MTSADFTLRTALGPDIGPIVEAWNRSLTRDMITEGRFARWLFADFDHDVQTGEGAWVAARDGEVIGFIRAIKRVMPNDWAGTEESDGWIPVIFTSPSHRKRGIGSALLEKAVKHLQGKGVKRIFVCGNTGSAPGYLFPGVDKDAYADALAFLLARGFVVDHEPIAMSGALLDYDVDKHLASAWEGDSGDVRIETLTPATVPAMLKFLRTHFPGDWNTAARYKLKFGSMDQALVALMGDAVVGWCQWESDGHFGPFGVQADIRGKKIGAKLFAEACKRLKAVDARHVWFNWADEDAARFYRRFGLEATRRFAILRKDL